MSEQQSDCTEQPHTDCAACGSLVMTAKNRVPVGYRNRDADAKEPVDIILCEACRFGILKELLSGNWSYSAHKLDTDTDK
ncbi:hypothetical protein [Haloarcula sp. CBA1129]|uniref:hypothetical protein n=1 Tax=Haloarcula sp. CBA1129 TaxID=1853684 RepID=UPI001248D1D8|nr:hypothetical protein [Haloarcula sp. CBA1129]KAA9399666.1 hypothetical protein Har1129_16150 [Haloarcula sp. CBA1129]